SPWMVSTTMTFGPARRPRSSTAIAIAAGSRSDCSRPTWRSSNGESWRANAIAASSAAKISEESAMARYVVHQLIQNLFKEPGLLDRLNSAPDAVYDSHGFTAAEREAFSEASPAALASIGVHPIL